MQYAPNINEFIAFEEIPRKNIVDQQYYETLVFTEQLSTNYFVCHINEQLAFNEKARLYGGSTYHVAINESLAFSEIKKSKVWVLNAADILHFNEFNSPLTIGDILVLIESLSMQLAITAKDALVLNENLKTNVIHAWPISEAITFNEGKTVIHF